ncbi:MAG: HEAT repeat domain-containing protein [Pirellulaceae bacterium]
MTFQILAKTGNEAAASVLLTGLESPHRAIQEGALRGLLARRSHVGQRELIRRWDDLSDRWKSIVAETPGRISGAVRDAILSGDKQLCENGCDAVLHLREYDLLPALINAAEDGSNPHGDLVARTLLQLAEQLYDELAAPRDYSRRRDPQLVRQHALSHLEKSIQRFDQHKRREILETFLTLVGRDNATLKRILQNPHDKCYLPLVDMLKTSPRVGVMRLVLNFLDDPHAPTSAINVLSHRGDMAFLTHLLKKIGYEPSSAARLNLRRMDSIVWLQDDFQILDDFDDAQQHAVVQLAMATSMKRLQVFEVIRYLLMHGATGGRRAAVGALAQFKGFEANALVQQSLSDKDPQVQAGALMQLRDRGIPGALTKLIDAADSPHDAVRHAAQQSLKEFNFRRYLSAFDTLDEEVRYSTGYLVRKVDPEILQLLNEELTARSRTRRLRGLELLPYVNSIFDLEPVILQMLSDEDHFVRAEAAKVLSESQTPAGRDALRGALLDASVMVREAAEQSLQQLASGGHAPRRPNSDSRPYLPPTGGGFDVSSTQSEAPW